MCKNGHYGGTDHFVETAPRAHRILEVATMTTNYVGFRGN